jgi:hypothetical protein
MITKADDPTHKQKAIYSLTEKAIELVPVFAMLGTWGRRHLPVSRELSIRAQLLEEGGSDTWVAFMEELRTLHLGTPKKPGARSVFAELHAAYEKVLTESRPRRAEASAPPDLPRAVGEKVRRSDRVEAAICRQGNAVGHSRIYREVRQSINFEKLLKILQVSATCTRRGNCHS